MIDLKKATKDELVKLLLINAQLIEDTISLYNNTIQDEYTPIFTGIPERTIQIENNFWDRLVEERVPREVSIIPDYIRNSVWSKREFDMLMCGHNYKIFNLYVSKEPSPDADWVCTIKA